MCRCVFLFYCRKHPFIAVSSHPSHAGDLRRLVWFLGAEAVLGEPGVLRCLPTHSPNWIAKLRFAGV